MALVTDTLDPWLVRFESALSRCLPVDAVGAFNRDARIRYDLTARYDVYRMARTSGC